jgi:hypothetical protein
MTIDTGPNKDLTETEDDRREVRRTNKGEGGRKSEEDTEQ